MTKKEKRYAPPTPPQIVVPLNSPDEPIHPLVTFDLVLLAILDDEGVKRILDLSLDKARVLSNKELDHANLAERRLGSN